MGRSIGKLSAIRVERIKQPGYYGDGGGLWLQVTAGADGAPRKSWVYRFTLGGKAREMGLGPLVLFGLHHARAKTLDARRLCHDGIDPIEARRQKRAQARLEAMKAITFKECAEAYVESYRAAWRNEKHASQWESTLEHYAYPVIGSLPVQLVDTSLVMKVLEPIWSDKPETASRLRGRVEAILDWAKVRGYRDGENPARWRGHLDKLFPAQSKLRRVKHHSALAYAAIPEFMGALRQQDGVGARALEFTILTAARTGETIGATWAEIDLAEKIWTIPAERMQGGREHRVPFCPRAVEILQELKPAEAGDSNRRGARVGGNGDQQRGEFVFPGAKPGKSLSNMALAMTLRRMERNDITVHGFRSTFRDWAAERTGFPREVAEMALAHAVGDKVEAAYRRGDLFERRRKVMADWGKFCGTGEAVSKNVTPFARLS